MWIWIIERLEKRRVVKRLHLTVISERAQATRATVVMRGWFVKGWPWRQRRWEAGEAPSIKDLMNPLIRRVSNV